MAHYCAAHGVTVAEAVVAMVEARRMIDPVLMTDPDRMAEAIARFRGVKEE